MKLDNRLWVIVTVLICGAMVAGGWFLGVQPQLAAASAADTQRATNEAQNQALAAQVTRLTAAKSKQADLTSQLEALTRAVPPGIHGSDFLAEIDGLVASTGVTLQAVTLGQAVPYAPPAGVDPAKPAGASPSASPSPSPSASPSGTAAPPATTGPPSIAPLTDPLLTAANFITVPVDVSVKGSAEQVAAFLSGLQKGDRLVLINKVDRQLDATTSEVTLSTHGTMYVLRDPSTAAAPAASATTG